MTSMATVHSAPVQSKGTEQLAPVPREESQDLGALTEVEFERGIERLQSRKVRAQRIFENVLVKDVHFGVIPGTKKPSLLKPGADELCMTFGLEMVYDPARPDVVVETEEYTSVTLYRAIIDRMNRVLDRTTASCTTKESRFKRQGGGWTYTDARADLNTCHAIAEKRAKIRLAVGALGLAPFLGTREEMDKAMAAAQRKPLIPWTEAEKRMVGEAASARGMETEEYVALRNQTLGGRTRAGTGRDVELLLEAIKKWQPPKKEGDTKAAPKAAAPTIETPDEDPTDVETDDDFDELFEDAP